jgi:hypothetical protein
MPATDWGAWHNGYADRDSILGERLRVVQTFIMDFLDSRPEGELAILSLCAGKGLDLLGVLSHHPSASRVKARLIELDSDLAAEARRTATRNGLRRVEVVVGDASCTDAFVGAVPADLVLACGVFGNLSDEDVERTVRAMPELCAQRGVVLWTRHNWLPDLNPSICRWFTDAGFIERGFVSPRPESYAVGMNELRASPQRLSPGTRLFTFIDPQTRPPSERATPTRRAS